MDQNSILQNSMNPEVDSDTSLELLQYLHVLLRFKWLIILCMVIMVSLALVHNSKMVPVYKATSTIIIDPEMPKIPMSQGFYYSQSYLSELYSFNTHFRLISSHTVLKKVVKRMNLDKIDKREEMEKFGDLSLFSKYYNQLKSNLLLLFS